MQAILAIVQAEDADVAFEQLKALNLPCLERIASSGSFLRQNNMALWMAASPGQVEQILNVLRDTCHRRTNYLPSYYIETVPMILALPLEVEVGGATVFICDVDYYEVF
jgi:uncharacterized protein YaaQ